MWHVEVKCLSWATFCSKSSLFITEHVMSVDLLLIYSFQVTPDKVKEGLNVLSVSFLFILIIQN